ncbi:hypothetical protein EVAR_57383_1 [Eumeta japonica]|uniref:Uncharacterized protein n=1 Tax=Eumeta variegata TaxID=151549 RepID=A0A4C1ZFR4_EUMVA|nr:hypothetical protein EVAR_57383_1 [Eumeta japonica]
MSLQVQGRGVRVANVYERKEQLALPANVVVALFNKISFNNEGRIRRARSPPDGYESTARAVRRRPRALIDSVSESCAARLWFSAISYALVLGYKGIGVETQTRRARAGTLGAV